MSGMNGYYFLLADGSQIFVSNKGTYYFNKGLGYKAHIERHMGYGFNELSVIREARVYDITERSLRALGHFDYTGVRSLRVI